MWTETFAFASAGADVAGSVSAAAFVAFGVTFVDAFAVAAAVGATGDIFGAIGSGSTTAGKLVERRIFDYRLDFVVARYRRGALIVG